MQAIYKNLLLQFVLGRFVIPVKQEYRSEVKGFIHDISSSGSTIFVEPTAIFEMNNHLNQLKLEESIEIEKILQQLTSLFYSIIQELKQNVEFISKIDFAFAKAKYARSLDATEPILQEERKIHLQKARHPLIAPEKVVPISVPLGKDFSCLIVTGPNTGGKTVTLKTVGLLCAMAASGLYIPAAEKSSTCVFDGIYADIGDEQSIQESLSTFSSHMTNIIEILHHATSTSLVLLDELGSGTDPIEGSSLAISLLKAFHERGSLIISTTHYPEIKNFALVTNGFENASSEFDVEHLRPTYRLLIGVPGQSNAFAISQRLGLDSAILEQAKSLVSSDRIPMEELLKHIYDDKKKIEEEKEIILQNSLKIEELKLSLEKEKSAIEENGQNAIAKAKESAREILISAKEEADEIIHQLEQGASQSEANLLRKKLKKKISETMPVSASSHVSSLSNQDITIGLSVFVKPLQAQGTVLTLPDKSGKVQVQIGNSKVYFSVSSLEKTSSTPAKVIAQHTPSTVLKTHHVSPEINLLGLTVEEATLLLDKYLDDCVLANLPTVRIVHGKGTGALRAGIHAFLKKHPHVKSFRLGTFGEGEMGVTIVETK